MLVVGAVLLGIISALVLTWPPGSDPFAWIDWGQEIASSKISLSLSGGPSWKPFPVLFTAVFGLFGSAAPHLWLMVSRSAGLLALLGAYRLARRFGGVAGGLLAVAALLLAQDALFYFARGASETLVAALTLWAVDRHLNGSWRLAFVLGFLAAMNRPEFGVFLLAYAWFLWPRVPGFRAALVAGIVLIPIAWFGAPGVISGNAFQAGNAALGGKGSPGSAIAELRSGFALMTVPIAVLSVIGLVLAYLRRNLVVVGLGVGAIAWALMEAVITQVAYGLPRYSNTWRDVMFIYFIIRVAVLEYCSGVVAGLVAQQVAFLYGTATQWTKILEESAGTIIPSLVEGSPISIPKLLPFEDLRR